MTQSPLIDRAAALLSCVAILWIFATISAASEREHDAHEHGVSRLNIAVDEKTIEIELMAPGVDIVGFEHAATASADKIAVKKAVATLQKGSVLFDFPDDANCRLEEGEVTSQLAEAHQAEHDDHAHEKKENGHSDDHKDAEESTHAEFHAHYHFHCAEPRHISHMEVKLFEHFPTMREIDVQAITSSGQSAMELTSTSARLMF